MGCIQSSDSDTSKHDIRNRTTLHTHVTINPMPVYSCRKNYTKSTPQYRTSSTTNIKPHPFFGEYKCSACGRSWNSRLCWPNSYQVCNRCKKPVYPYFQRELHSTDTAGTKNNQEHKKDLCQMCQQLGYYCGNFGKRNLGQRKYSY